MIEERDIVETSLALVAGAAFAAVSGRSFPGISLVSSFLTLWLLASRKSPFDRIWTVLLWLQLGYFCFSSYRLSGASFASPLSISWLSKRIDSIPFAGGATAPLLKALLTGEKGSLDRATITAFRESGASHVLALSGLHLGIIYGTVAKLLSLAGRSRMAYRVRAGVCVTLCGLYALSTGAAPSIVRAFLFIVIGETGRLCTWRKVSPIRTWCLALSVQTVLCPAVILSLGFQLSYLAMLGIFLVFPLMRDWYPKSAWPSPLRKVWEAVALSCSCQLLTGPLVWLKFGTFPKYFILTNLIALPLTEALILGGLGAVVWSVFGECPELLVRGVDFLAKLLTDALGIIAGM